MFINLILYVICGACCGSFMSLLATRITRGESIIQPRSHCDNCLHPMKWCELIPLISYLALNGRCRYCKSKIPFQNFMVEIIVTILFGLDYFTFQPLSEILFQILLILLSLLDLKTLEMPTIIILLLFTSTCGQLYLWHQFQWANLSLGFCVYLILLLINAFHFYLGNGDLDVILILFLKIGFSQLAPLLAIASGSALIMIFLNLTHARKIAFVPYLTLAYLLIWFF